MADLATPTHAVFRCDSNPERIEGLWTARVVQTTMRWLIAATTAPSVYEFGRARR